MDVSSFAFVIMYIYAMPRYVQLFNKIANFFRITSYNVCYTKLLRITVPTASSPMPARTAGMATITNTNSLPCASSAPSWTAPAHDQPNERAAATISDVFKTSKPTVNASYNFV